MSRRKTKILFLLCSLLLMTIILIFLYQRNILSEHQHIEFSIPKGAGVLKVEQLINQSIDASGYAYGIPPYFLYLELYQQKQLKKIKAGDYRIEGPITLDKIAQIVIQGQESSSMPITIVEGLNRWQVADLLQSNGLIERQAFLDEIKHRESKGESVEGRLFPDTYMFLKKSSASDIMDILLGNFEKKWKLLLDEYANQYPQLKNAAVKQKIITLASLVEKETQLSTEAPMIAKVFYNRLSKGMKLQTDPTCVYDEKYYQQKPSPSLCKSLNPKYSTYLIEGLPPTPIANPGLNSLKAAIVPSQEPQSDEYFYFVAKRDGTKSHFFSKDYQTHQQAIEQYLKPNQNKLTYPTAPIPLEEPIKSGNTWTGADVKKSKKTEAKP
jgi:UPF0755 protein